MPLTVNITLSPHCDYDGGGTYFPARAAECNGFVLRPHAGTAVMHGSMLNLVLSPNAASQCCPLVAPSSPPVAPQ